MRTNSLGFILLLGASLLSCSNSTLLNSPSNNSPLSQNPSLSTQGQMLPITAKAIIGDQVIQLEVATTPEQQALGLMYRTSLPKDRGMLFPFSSPRYASFWMKNVPISLDMIFLKDETIKAVFSHVPPCKSDPCPVYGPSTLINQVIEIPAGRASELGLKAGDRIKIESISSP